MPAFSVSDDAVQVNLRSYGSRVAAADRRRPPLLIGGSAFLILGVLV